MAPLFTFEKWTSGILRIQPNRPCMNTGNPTLGSNSEPDVQLSVTRRSFPRTSDTLSWTFVLVILLTALPANLSVMADEVTQSVNPAAGSQPPKPMPPAKVNRTEPAIPRPSSAFFLPNSAKTLDLKQARLFAEPLVPVGGEPVAADNQALAATLRAFAVSRDPQLLDAFVKANPASPWAASVLTNLGLLKFQQGYFTAALAAWNQAWTQGKSATDPAAQAIVNRAVAELIKMYCRVGRKAEAETLLAEVGKRPLHGVTANLIGNAQQAVRLMENQPAECFKCGPYALRSVLVSLKQETPQNMALIAKYPTTSQGTSLAQVSALASQTGLKLQMAKRVSGGELPLPAVALNSEVEPLRRHPSGRGRPLPPGGPHFRHHPMGV